MKCNWLNNKTEYTPQFHVMQLREQFLTKIINGEKIYEIRLFDEKRQQIKIGDEILFLQYSDFHKRQKVKVLHIYKYKDFDEMLSVYALESLGFKGYTKKQACERLKRIYSDNDVKKYGVVVFNIEKTA